ncbi:NAD(P)/FAD-dependent oxidoreductase [Methylotenera versatilis]|uniref:Amine oxidase n=1 Tax=Methylotenera versatilis (strain 301) TaxID=666681 RepID=D7DIH2_METV0|nr:FAD-dependent oxidoreductase [Methylotenera versatilis]ADI29857.1 amine oxidase [Methylotenera versatilis 301]
MKIAIIGSGIAGNTIAYHLNKQHDVTVFEAESHIGGHTHTHHIKHEGNEYNVDTGFIVFNDRTYPNFIALLDELKVAWQPSEMSFSVQCEKTGLEYNGTNLNSLFAQRRNLFKPSFHQMIRDILRFNKTSLELLTDGNEIKLGDYLKQGKYSQQFIDHYIIPMGSAIWSTEARQMLDFPARFFVRFFHHHGMLTVNNRPQWRTITNGSASYVSALTESFKDKIRLNTPVESVRRLASSVRVKPLHGDEEKFDYVFFACHSDQALKLLSDKKANEIEILSAIPYQQNTIFLHHDVSLMPKRKLAWAAWNYHVTNPHAEQVAVTYNMNILQNLQSNEPLLVTLNHTKFINPAKVIKRLKYMHPIYTLAGAAAQARHAEISGKNRTGFAGAYWRNGFHEDGVVSALEAIKHFEQANIGKA